MVDTALEKREAENKPVRLGMIGAGHMGRVVARQLLKFVKGMRLVAIANRTLSNAARAFEDAGVDSVTTVHSVRQMEEAVSAGRPVITDDPTAVCGAGGIDAIIEVTGEVEAGAHNAMCAIENGKHLILVNAELDSTVGPILKVYADRQGVVITNTDGDEPGVAMNLIRMVKTFGYRPVLAGNFKGMLDPYRTPETQKGFAEKHNQAPRMVTSYADGTKLSMETTILANATGFKVGKRGMFGHKCDHVRDVLKLFSPEQFQATGLVDFLLGAEPHTGAFVVVHDEDPVRRQLMDYLKMGEGPLHVFYTPYHLPHLQVVSTVARAVLFHDPTVAPAGPPMCDSVTIAKRDLKRGEVLDGIGGFTCFGVTDNSEVARKEDLLPMGLSGGCRLKRDVARDQAISYNDVDLPQGRLCDQLRAEQNRHFAPAVVA